MTKPAKPGQIWFTTVHNGHNRPSIRPSLPVKQPTLSPIAPVSPDDLDKHYELGQFLTRNPVAEFMASLFIRG